MTRAFGETVFDVIEADPDRLREVEGIGPVRAARIAAGWAEQKVVREIMLFLHAHGVGTSRAVRIYKTYGAEAVAIISENPYRLARDIRGIGFKTADQIAAKLGIAKDAMVRVRAGVSYALAEAMDEGHGGRPEDDLLRTGAELLDVSADRLTAALALELQDGTVVANTVGERRCIFLASLYRAEQEIAWRLRDLAAGEPPWPEIDVDRAIPWLEVRGGITLATSQREALRLAGSSKALVITGGPGVGKTTLVNSILKMLVAKSVNVALCAPTGRAAKRLTETTGVDAKTIHRLLETDPKNGGFKRDETNPLGCDLLVVDETSMVDVLLMKALVRALPTRAALLLVGDVDQLPSVGPGQVLADIIDSGAVPVVRLTEVFRQAATSRVIVNAHRINAGLMPEATPAGAERSDFYVIDAAEPEIAAAKILAVVREDPTRLRARPGPRRPGALPDESRRGRRPLAQHRAPKGAESTRRGSGRAIRLDLRAGRQGHADRERLRQGGEGVYAGGKRRLDRDRIKALRAAGNGPAAIARVVGCSRMQVYRVLQDDEVPTPERACGEAGAARQVGTAR